MSFSTTCAKVVATSTVLLGATLSALPAQALLISGTPNYAPSTALPTTITVTAPISANPNGAANDDKFSSLNTLTIGSLLLNSGSPTAGFNANYGNTLGYLTDFRYLGVNAVIDLLANQEVVHAVIPGGAFTVSFNVNGVIRAASDSRFLGTIAGTFSASQGVGQIGNYSLDITSTPVPTPALLPGLIGMGAAALRKKRKGEEFEASPETVEVDA